MPVAGSEVYCNAANKNTDLVSAAETKIRDMKEEIKKYELEIKQRKALIKQQQRNCKAWRYLDDTIALETNPFSFGQKTGGKSRRKKCKKSRMSRRR